ncbi:hypothetical protein OG780_43050 [Streptomyces sp. NBC_00386]|uniref:hypothetical protein n=1 Tax=Streptomyces sp. NBC_00386 TaxID=2975734 RepID=UPI002E1A6DE0
MDVHYSFTSDYAQLHPLIEELSTLPNRWDDAPARVLIDVRGALQYWTERDERPAQASQLPPARSGASGIALFLAWEDSRLERLALHLFRGLLDLEEARERADLACILFFERIANDVMRAARRGSLSPAPGAWRNALDATPSTADTVLPVVAACLLWVSRSSGLHGRFDAESQAQIARTKYKFVGHTLDTTRELLSCYEVNALEDLTRQVEERLQSSANFTASWLMALSDIELFEAQLWQRHEWAAALREPGLAPLDPQLDHFLAPAQDVAPSDARDLAILDRVEFHVLDQITDPAFGFGEGSLDQLYAERVLIMLRKVAAHDVVALRHPSRSALVHILRDVDVALAECSDSRAAAEQPALLARVVIDTVEVHHRRLEPRARPWRATSQGAQGVGGTLRYICEFEYIKLLRRMADRLFDGAATVESKHTIRFPSERTAKAAVPALERELNSEGIRHLGTTVRLPGPAAFGLRMKRARTCRCSRHQEVLANGVGPL